MAELIHQNTSHRNTRLHGNGFIQCDIAPHTRLHVWWPARIAKAQEVSTPIHSHTFDFTSRVIKGALENRTYRIRPNLETHKLLSVVSRDGEDTKLGNAVLVGIHEDEMRVYHAGESYNFPAGAFHESVPHTSDGPVITVMTKTRVHVTAGPWVLCPYDREPDNTFNRYSHMIEAKLDQIILEAFKA